MNGASLWAGAWGQCYKYFGNDDQLFDEETASLRLAFFLANFGMFRASSKLRTLELESFSQIVRLVRTYRSLRDLKPSDLLKHQHEIEEYLQQLGAVLSKLCVSPTPTLVTKIALGTTACVPAYDRFVIIAMKERGMVARPSSQGLTQLYKLRRSDFSEKGSPIDQSVPFMRLVDIALMRRGEILHRARIRGA